LKSAGPVAINPVDLLPPQNSYPPDTKIAELTGLPYSDDAKLFAHGFANPTSTARRVWMPTEQADHN